MDRLLMAGEFVLFFLVWPFVFLRSFVDHLFLHRLRTIAQGTICRAERQGDSWTGTRLSIESRVDEVTLDLASVVRARQFLFLDTYEGFHQATDASILSLRLAGGKKVVLVSEPDGEALDELTHELKRRGLLPARRPRKLWEVSFFGVLFFGGLWLLVIFVVAAVFHQKGPH